MMLVNKSFVLLILVVIALVAFANSKMHLKKKSNSVKKDPFYRSIASYMPAYRKSDSHSGSEGSGHYEKVERKVDSYFFVSGNKPSGLPGAYVVPETEALGKLNNLK